MKKQLSFVFIVLSFFTVGLLVGCQKDELPTANEADFQTETSKGEVAEKRQADPIDREFDREMQQLITSMMGEMNRMEMTCDPDVDFANMMIMHHELGIKMAELELEYGHEERGMELAEATIVSNANSIVRLEAYLNSNEELEPLSNKDCQIFMKDMRQDMSLMMQCMRKTKDTPDPDVDFALLMICHHQGALAMAETELRWGKDEPTLTEAEMIIEAQTQEIIELSEFINEHGIPAQPAL